MLCWGLYVKVSLSQLVPGSTKIFFQSHEFHGLIVYEEGCFIQWVAGTEEEEEVEEDKEGEKEERKMWRREKEERDGQMDGGTDGWTDGRREGRALS